MNQLAKLEWVQSDDKSYKSDDDGIIILIHLAKMWSHFTGHSNMIILECMGCDPTDEWFLQAKLICCLLPSTEESGAHLPPVHFASCGERTIGNLGDRVNVLKTRHIVPSPQCLVIWIWEQAHCGFAFSLDWKRKVCSLVCFVRTRCCRANHQPLAMNKGGKKQTVALSERT